MLLGLAYQLMRFVIDLVLVRIRSDAELRTEVSRLCRYTSCVKFAAIELRRSASSSEPQGDEPAGAPQT